MQLLGESLLSRTVISESSTFTDALAPLVILNCPSSAARLLEDAASSSACSLHLSMRPQNVRAGNDFELGSGFCEGGLRSRYCTRRSLMGNHRLGPHFLSELHHRFLLEK